MVVRLIQLLAAVAMSCLPGQISGKMVESWTIGFRAFGLEAAEGGRPQLAQDDPPEISSGLAYFGYRYYSPRLGRWLSRDPMGEAGGVNLYAYCGNDPANKHDYLGMETRAELNSAVSTTQRLIAEIAAGLAAYNDAQADLGAMIAATGPIMMDGKPLSGPMLNTLASVLAYQNSGMLVSPELAAFDLESAERTISLSENRLEKMAQTAAFLADSTRAGTVSFGEAFDSLDDRSELYQGLRCNMFWVGVNPSSNITKHAWKGEYGQAGLAFGTDILTASLFGVGGEFLTAGKVSFGFGRLPWAGSGVGGSMVNKGVGTGNPIGWFADSYRGIRLRSLHRAAVRDVDAAIAGGDMRALAGFGASPSEIGYLLGNNGARFRGTLIDRLAKGRASTTFGLRSLERPGPGVFGPDFWNPVTRRAWDMTTEAQWRRHVRKYVDSEFARVLYPLFH